VQEFDRITKFTVEEAFREVHSGQLRLSLCPLTFCHLTTDHSETHLTKEKPLCACTGTGNSRSGGRVGILGYPSLMLVDSISHSLLVGMQNGIVTLEDIWKFLI
jgi:hypothetical protein